MDLILGRLNVEERQVILECLKPSTAKEGECAYDPLIDDCGDSVRKWSQNGGSNTNRHCGLLPNSDPIQRSITKHSRVQRSVHQLILFTLIGLRNHPSGPC